MVPREDTQNAPVEFRTDKRKIIEALVYLATARPRIDVFHMAKVFFYADTKHLRSYGRPVLGDAYVAMDDGPVPSFALNVAKRVQRFVSDDLLKIAADKLSVDDSDGYVRLTAHATFDDSAFSRTDIECLDWAIDTYADMPMIKLWRLVHKEKAYLASYRGNGTSTKIGYELFIPDDIEDRDTIIAQLREQSQITNV